MSGKTKTKKANCEMLLWDVPMEVKLKFKAKCAEKNITMRQALIDLMNEFSTK